MSTSQDSKPEIHPDAPSVPNTTGSFSPSLPEIPTPELAIDLSLGFQLDSIIGSADPTLNPEAANVQKRASNVMKLAQENEKLKEELKAMSDRLEVAERKREELLKRSQQG